MKNGRRVVARLVVLLLAVLECVAIVGTPAQADDGGYPYAAVNGAGSNPAESNWYDDSGRNLSPYRYNYRNCTDFVAWKLDTANGFKVSGSMGNAANWGIWATDPNHHYDVNMTPAIGSIAWQNSNFGGGFGHVAYVVGFDPVKDTVDIQEYNWYVKNAFDGLYHTETVPRLSRSGYIHFKDISTPPTAPAPSGNHYKSDLVVRNPSNNTWPKGVSSGTAFLSAGNALEGWGKGDATFLADVNGDGKADIVIHDPANNTYVTAINDGRGNFSYGGIWLYGWGAGDWAGMADITGDGKADLVVHSPDNTWAVAVSTGSSFTGIGWGLVGWGRGDVTLLADMNGDGKSDLVVRDTFNNNFVVALSDGSGHFIGAGPWLIGWGKGDADLAGDVNGDGKADLVMHNPANATWYVALSTGSSFVNGGIWLYGWGAGDWAGLADVNGDGKADLVVHDPANARFVVATSFGTGFGGPATGVWLLGWGAGDWAGIGNVDGN